MQALDLKQTPIATNDEPSTETEAGSDEFAIQKLPIVDDREDRAQVLHE